MNAISGRLVVLAGAALALVGLLAFGLATPSTVLGGEDTGLQTDVNPGTTGISVDDASVAPGGETNVTVNITDDAGNPVAGTTCTFSIGSQPGTDASVSSDPVTTDANGNATATVQVGSTEGQIDIVANCGGETVTVSVVAGEAAAPPASLPQTGIEGLAPAGGSTSTLLVMLLAALGVTLTGAGLIAVRNRQATDE